MPVTSQSDISPLTFRFPSLGADLNGVSTYTMVQRFAQPTSFELEIEDNQALGLFQALKTETVLQVLLDGHIQATFFITGRKQSTGKVTLSGKDALGILASSHLSTHVKFSPGMSLTSVVQAILNTLPFPGGKTLTVAPNNAKNIQAILGVVDNSDDTPPKSEIGQFSSSNFKVKRGEGALEFLTKIISRFDLYMWASADGNSIIVDSPSWDGTPDQKIVRHVDGNGNNVEDGEIDFDISDQPSFIYAAGRGSGNDFDHASMKVVSYNEFMTDPSGEVRQEIFNYIKSNPDLTQVTTDGDGNQVGGTTSSGLNPTLVQFRKLLPDMNDYPIVPAFMVDSHANTVDELLHYVRKTLSSKQNACIRAHYVLAGHKQGGIPWSVNHMVTVDDDRLAVSCNWFVLERKFTQSRDHGTRSTLTLIPPYTL